MGVEGGGGGGDGGGGWDGGWSPNHREKGFADIPHPRTGKVRLTNLATT